MVQFWSRVQLKLRTDHDPGGAHAHATPWVGPRACPGLHFSDTGEPRGEAELPSGKKTEGAGPQGAPAGEAATSIGAPRRSRREPRGEPVGSARHSARSDYRERDVNPARFSAAARQERTERLRRDRAAAQALRVAFPAVQHLRLELKFESTTSSTPASQSHLLHPPARAFFEFPCPYADCDGQFDLTSAVNTALADPAHNAEGMLECSGLRAHDYASKRPCQLHLIYAVTATYQ